MGIQPRTEALSVNPVVHGAIDFGELERERIDPQAVDDFSVNSNPFGPSPLVRPALEHVPVDRYPDREALALRRALGADLSLPETQIVVGNGTSELLSLLASAFIRRGDRALIVGPTYGEYARSVQLQGGRLATYAASPEGDFAVNPHQILRLLDRGSPRLAFVCRPNNPTGWTLPLETLDEWRSRFPGTLFVVDEAYLAFAQGCPSALSLAADNIVVLRSMTKDHALAGLRLGYAAGPASIISALDNVRVPWSVNAFALAAGLVTLRDRAHLEWTLAEIQRAKAHLVDALTDSGYRPVPSAAHFFLLRVGDGASFRRRLLESRIMVRDCASFGLPAYVRVATRRPLENERLVAAIRCTELDRGR